MSTLVSSKELIDLIKNVYELFHTKEATVSKSSLNSLCRYIPSIREQLQVNFLSIYVSWLLSELKLSHLATYNNFSFPVVFAVDIRTGRMVYVRTMPMGHSCTKTGTVT